MSSAGSPESRIRWLWLALLAGACAVIFAVTVGAQTVGLLAAIVSPPEPPVPGEAVLVTYASEAHGFDRWEFQVSTGPCDVIAFYVAQGGQCAVRHGWCDGDDPGLLEIGVARCIGDVSFSSFALRWRADVAVGSDRDTTRLTLEREVSWMGALPPETVVPP